jgi:hypothetical protein
MFLILQNTLVNPDFVVQNVILNIYVALAKLLFGLFLLIVVNDTTIINCVH